MQKVLIIGAKGMLGQELVKVFSVPSAQDEKKYEVVAWDKEEINITDEAQVKNKIRELAPQIIINAAAYNSADKCEEPEYFEVAKKINGLAPGYLAQVAKSLGAIFTHYSTDYIFDGKNKDGYNESAFPSPISKYGESKLLGEKQVAAVGGQYYIIRLQRLFGSPAKSIEAKKSFFDVMLKLSQEKKELGAVDEELANFTYAPDLALQTKYLIEKKLPTGIYHITNEGSPATWFGAAEALFKVAGVGGVKLIPLASSLFPRPAKRPKYSVLLNTKLPPLRPWNEALKEFLSENKRS
ncbi:MAG TPA: dTDP-4-dehydrorhamnose reductase [Candidatus Portnoybacteria bacterium]|nr:dTDP-4-dehydrorhamnose reductase [Candidatus Portnoybacteria bacterium]